MKTLYVTDLDGTLLNEKAELSDYTVKILSRLIGEGKTVTFATARTSATAFSIVRDVPFCLPAVLMNGVFIYDMASGECLLKNFLPEPTVRDLELLLREHGVSSFVYRLLPEGLMTYYEELTSDVRRNFVESRTAKYGKPFRKVDDFLTLPASETAYFCILEPKEKLDPVAEILRKRTDIGMAYYRDVYHDGMWFLELYSAKASKRNAVDWLRDYLKPDEIVGFGDNLNDLPLFEGCDRRYAVENAAEELKAAADAVIGANTADGVPRFLENEE